MPATPLLRKGDKRPAEDAFRRMLRLELESEALDKRYEMFHDPTDDLNWMKQFFSPCFMVWLAEEAPDGFTFECSAGSLCINLVELGGVVVVAP